MAGSSIAAGKGGTLINVRFTVISKVARRTHARVPIHAILEKEERRLPTNRPERGATLTTHYASCSILAVTRTTVVDVHVTVGASISSIARTRVTIYSILQRVELSSIQV